LYLKKRPALNLKTFRKKWLDIRPANEKKKKAYPSCLESPSGDREGKRTASVVKTVRKNRVYASKRKRSQYVGFRPRGRARKTPYFSWGG